MTSLHRGMSAKELRTSASEFQAVISNCLSMDASRIAVDILTNELGNDNPEFILIEVLVDGKEPGEWLDSKIMEIISGCMYIHEDEGVHNPPDA